MKRYKTLFAVLLTVLSLGFIVFVVFMQQQFNNPEFSGLSATTTSKTEQVNEETDADAKSDTVAGAAGSVVSNEEDESEEEENNNEESETGTDEVTTSIRTVIAETLNARSGPGIEYEVTGVLVLDQVVEVEDHGEEWVKITTEEFTGYVNEKYLSEEE